METTEILKINRYPGVKPFSENDDQLFFGRKNDIEAFDSLLFVKQNVVLYGKSGYGKSSLINAGIVPLLKQAGVYAYFLLRFNNYSEKKEDANIAAPGSSYLTPLQTVKMRLAENIVVDTTSRFYKLIPGEDSLWYWIKQNQLATGKSKFIIFFDQFEELFTYPKEDVANFSEQLSQLLYGTLPVNYRKKVDELQGKPILNDKLQQFLYEKPEIKIVYSIRGDRLAMMNALTDRHPSILQNMFELDALTEPDARLAIIEPSKLTNNPDFKTGVFSYTEGAINKILKSVANKLDGKIETSTLQIICRYIEDTLVAENGNTIITEEILGNITGIFQQYYENILNKLNEDDRVKVRLLIEDLLISGDQRNSFTVGYIKLRFRITDALLAVLEQSTLLRKERDANGKVLYEISHDSIVGAINNIVQKRKKEEDELKKIELEQQVEQEKIRSEALEKSNRTSLFRYRLAMGMLAIALVAVVFAVMSAIDAKREKENFKKEKENAERERKIALEKENTANAELYRNNLLRAKDFIDGAKTFTKSENFEYAVFNLNQARELVRHAPARIEKQDKKDSANEDAQIDSLLKECKGHEKK